MIFKMTSICKDKLISILIISIWCSIYNLEIHVTNIFISNEKMYYITDCILDLMQQMAVC